MTPLSATSTIKSAVLSGTVGSDLTPRHGSTVSAGTTSADQDRSRAWLARHTPAEVDAKIIHSLTSELNVSVSVNREWRFPENKPPYQLATTAGISAPSKANVARAITKVELALTPPTHEDAELMVAQLQAALARRSSSQAASEVGYDMYVSCLRRHPADVVRATVAALALGPRKDGSVGWFPTLPELEGELRKRSADRMALLAGLRNWREPDPGAARVAALKAEWRRLQAVATDLSLKVGPGPAQDTGERGERIEKERVAQEAASAAKQAWLDADAAEKGVDKRSGPGA